MKKKKFLFVILSVVLAIFVVVFIFNIGRHILKGASSAKSESAEKQMYHCPMHPTYISDKPGDCPICGMKLVKMEKSPTGQKPAGAKKERKVLYYRNPMDPTITSPVPMKDSMGMDYVPVYEEEDAGETGVYISPEKQQLIGVKTGAIRKMALMKIVRASGRIAYDPDLYVAQEEYLQALKTAGATKNSVLVSIAEQSDSLLKAAEKKLLLLGMNKAEIEELSKKGAPQENLYLPIAEDTVWIYIAIYEYEVGLVKIGTLVEVESVAYPGEVFKGKIISINPVLDPMTRTNQVRVEVENPEGKLKPEMFVNAKIKVDLGEKLAVPDTAVLDTGTRKIVYLLSEGNVVQSRDITVGQKAAGYYEVLGGLKEGDVVVTSGNFLVDSESKLKSASQEAEHRHE